MTGFEKFIDVLEQINSSECNSGTYYAQYSMDPNELELSVNIKGCSDLTFPLSISTIHNILTVTEPAKFGLRDQTLYDKDVRDTNEIAADKININFNGDKFFSIIENIKHQLGFSNDICLQPHLHNILIYSKGQFFAEHQDTEKLEGMIGTLVMVLPSPHIGGTLKIKHYGEEIECKSENINSTDVKFFAFYSDAQHEITPVLDGYRVVATYNLVAKSIGEVGIEDIDLLINHKKSLKKAMLTALKELEVSSSDFSPSLPHITYLLNHQYTKHGLSWNLLRGVDRLRVELIKMAAIEADCELWLTLIEARESWSTNGGYGYGDSNEGEEPEELIDSEIDLVHVLDRESKSVSLNLSIREKMLCYHLPNNEFKPFETEYEGYMGNYGNTVDFWYYRAAIIILRKSDQFVLSFLNDSNAVIKQLIDHPTLNLCDQLKQLWPYWIQYKWHAIDLRLLVQLAIAVNEPNVAGKILEFCSNATLLKGANDLLCKLFAFYGTDWATKNLTTWLSINKLKRDHQVWGDQFGLILHEFINNNADLIIINKLIDCQISYIKLSDSATDIQKPKSLAKSAQYRISVILDLIKVLELVKDVRREREVLEYVILQSKLYSLLELVTLLKEIKVADVHFLLKTYLLNDLDEEIKAGLRAENNWSINAKSTCNCQSCKELNKFMKAESEVDKRWPLVQDMRNHIEDMVRSIEVPIDLGIDKNGRPYKLLLAKSNSIHTDAKARFEAICLAYQKLLDA